MTKKTKTVVKVQAALNRPGSVLMYDERNTFCQEGHEPKIWAEIMALYENGDIPLPKVYCDAIVSKKRIHLDGRASDQDPGW